MIRKLNLHYSSLRSHMNLHADLINAEKGCYVIFFSGNNDTFIQDSLINIIAFMFLFKI